MKRWWIAPVGRSWLVLHGQEVKARLDGRRVVDAEGVARRTAVAMAGGDA